ncbi:MAG: hypothetical protein M3Z24_11185 [Chloroflexota bacterium]|nr:hypothetical protein [Chloroflexota bacterium]
MRDEKRSRSCGIHDAASSEAAWRTVHVTPRACGTRGVMNAAATHFGYVTLFGKNDQRGQWTGVMMKLKKVCGGGEGA